MSKYYKAEDVDLVCIKNFANGDVLNAIRSLPTIEVSEDCISRAKAIKEVKALPNTDNGYSDTYDKALIISVLEELPSVAPQAKEGEWIDKGDYAECSNCGANSGTQFDGVEPVPCKTKFCPDCGAKMKGAEE